MASGGGGDQLRRSRIRGGTASKGLRTMGSPEEAESAAASTSLPLPTPGHGAEMPEEEPPQPPPAVYHSAPSTRGRKAVRPGVERVSLHLKIYEDEKQKFVEISKKYGKSERETLLMLMAMYDERTSAQTEAPAAAVAAQAAASAAAPAIDPEVSEPDSDDEVHQMAQGLSPIVSTPVRPPKKPRTHREEEHQATAARSLFQLPRPPTLSLSTLQTAEHAFSQGLTSSGGGEVYLDDSSVAANVDVYEYNENEPEFNVQEQQPGNISAANLSLNLQSQVQPLISPFEEESRTDHEDDVAGVELEPVRTDYEKGIRLLPTDFHTTFSQGAVCRIYKPPRPDNDMRGHVNPVDPLRNTKPQLKSALEIAQAPRYIVELRQLGKLISPKCYRNGCDAMNDLANVIVGRDGAVVTLKISCRRGHLKEWAASERLQHMSSNQAFFYVLNMAIPAAIIISGNQYGKQDRFFRALELRNVSKAHFYQMQAGIVVPVVWDSYAKMQDTMADRLSELNADLVVSCDGQSDSPGHSATYTTYTNMITGVSVDGGNKYEQTAYIADVCVIERRHTELNSNAMELAGFLLGMDAVTEMGGRVKEVVTDMHLQILHLMKWANAAPARFKLKATDVLKNFEEAKAPDFIDHLQAKCRMVKHQLDAWHFVKNMGKKLQKTKGQRITKDERANYEKWVVKIKNHFWHCAETCEGQVAVLKDKWMSLLHHIKGEHKWVGGRCENPERCEHERTPNDPTYLNANSTLFKHVQRIVGEKRVLDMLQYYVQFRHTGELESYHQLTLAYGNKRTFFGYKAMASRKFLAAIDHNASLHRPVLRDRANPSKPRYKVIYSKPAGRYIARIAKAPKTYTFIPHLMAKCLSERCSTEGRFYTGAKYHKPVPKDPNNLPPSLARLQLDRQQVIDERIRRFGNALNADDEDDRRELEHDDDSEYSNPSEDEDESDEELSEEFPL